MVTLIQVLTSERQAPLLQKRLENYTVDPNRQEMPHEEGHSYWRSSDRTLLREKMTVSEMFSSHMEDYFYFY